MAGLIYCFSTLGDPKVYKAGHTQNSLSTRMRGYLGPSKPRVIIFSRRVDDSAQAEKMMLSLCRQCVSLKVRPDLGDEWFEDVTVAASVLHQHLQQIADIVQLASRVITMGPTTIAAGGGPLDGGPPLQPLDHLRGMDFYFQRLDEFVRSAPQADVTHPDRLVSKYEASDVCPVFSEYLPFTFAQRVHSTARRYSHLFDKGGRNSCVWGQ